MKDKHEWFDHKTPTWGFVDMIPHAKLYKRDGGFLVNREVKIVVEVYLTDSVGKLDVSKKTHLEFEDESCQESGEASCSVKKPKLNDDDDCANSSILLEKTQQMREETMEVHGFRILHSQANLVSRIFKKYPDIALKFRAKNEHLRTACMNVLLSLIETLCQSPQELSDEDLLEADNALAHMKDAGFKVDWLEKKLREVKERKKEDQTSAVRIQELEEKVKDFKKKWVDMEALLEKEKAKALTAKASLTLYDFL